MTTLPATVASATSSAAMAIQNQLFGHGNSTSIINYSANSLNDSTLDNTTEENYIYNRWDTTDRKESYVVPMVFAFIFVVGLVGNGTLITAAIANKVMRNVPNILIVSLSVGDFLLILVSVPVTCTYYTFANWPFGNVMCKVNEFVQTVSLGVSIFTLTALSADRYVAIVDPMAKLAGRTPRTTVGIAASIWAVSILLAIPDAVFSSEVTYVIPPNKFTACYQFPKEMGATYPKVFFTVRMCVFFIFPILTIGFFYAMMAHILIRSSDSVPTESKTGAANHHRQIAARKKVAKVVLSFVIIFMICWLPRHIYLMWYYFDDGAYNLFWHVFKVAGFCLKFINSCVNPFALYFLSSQFRKYYNSYLFCCMCPARYSSLEPTSTMHNMHSTTRRHSGTNTSMVHSQSMC